MRETSNARLTRLLELAIGSLTPPVGKRRIIVAISYGIICHFIFLLAVISMMTAMFFGMSQSLGGVPPPWNIAANLALILQFPLAHYFIEAGTIWLWSDIGHNHVCHNCLGSIIGIICFLDAKWNDLVAGTRLAFGYNLDALCSFLAPFDMGQL